MNFCTYRTDTGEILKWTSHPEAPPDGCVCEERDLDARDGYIAPGGTFVAMPERPGPWASWSWSVHAWVDPRTPQQALDEQWAKVRTERDRLMADFEWRINRYARQVRLGLTTTDDHDILDAYMQALADITLQSDPFAIVWPTPPA